MSSISKVNIILYMIIFFGISIYNIEFISRLYFRVTGRFVVKREIKTILAQRSQQNYDGVLANLANLICATGYKNIFPRPEDFILVSAFSGLATFAVLYLANIGNTSMVAAAFVSVLPYLILRLRLHQRRVNISKLGESLTNEIVNNYRISNCNLIETIDLTMNSLDENKELELVLAELSHRLREGLGAIKIRKALDNFVYSIGTGWAQILALNFLFAYETGSDISSGLEELRKALSEKRKVTHVSKRENNDSKLIIKFLAPITYVSSILGAILFFRFSIAKFISYQFFSPLGMKWLVIMLVSYCSALIAYMFISEEKVDV